MLLKSLLLKNIRSYKNTKINFPQGKVLLTGDIGSGKSTILMAIEFALFGQGEVGYQNLLRHGENEGTVELELSIKGRNYTITRELKKTKRGITQAECKIKRDGMEQKLTPTELKSEVLLQLGYPQEFLNKDKNPLYRYTVYTPQENMKSIITMKEEERIDILRKIFDMDKFKRVKENSSTYLKSLRDKMRLLEAKAQGIEGGKKELEQNKEEISKLSSLLSDLEKQNKEVKQELELKKKGTESIEKKREEFLDKQNLVKIKEFKKNNIAEQLKKTLKDEEILKEKQKSFEEFEGGENNFDEQIKKMSDEIKRSELKITELVKEMSQHHSRKKQSEEIIKKIKELDSCPLCLQNVGEEHKHYIMDAENSKIEEVLSSLERLNSELKELDDKKEKNGQELEKLRQYERKAIELRTKRQQMKEVKQQLEEAADSRVKLAIEFKKISEELIELKQSINFEIEEEYKKTKEEFEKIKEKEKTIEIKLHTTQKEISLNEKYSERIKKEIDEKHNHLESKKKISKQHNWMEEGFLPLVNELEKRTFGTIYQEFNSLFVQWFSALVEDELLTARLDDKFTPIIIQNEYETEVSTLSGGERTACALAYRLALNKIINDWIHNIKTKQLLILDEPTEGFSDVQVDKLKDVLDELGMRQAIIVSHEPKIEGFVDHVIRLEKRGHITSTEVI